MEFMIMRVKKEMYGCLMFWGSKVWFWRGVLLLGGGGGGMEEVLGVLWCDDDDCIFIFWF